MRYFRDTTGQVHAFDETLAFFAPLIEKAIVNNWTEVTGSWPPAETQAEAQTRLSNDITKAINAVALQWGYDSIVAAVSYLNSSNPQFVSDAKALSAWRDQVWAWAIPALSAAQSGETANTFLAGMPAAPTKS